MLNNIKSHSTVNYDGIYNWKYEYMIRYTLLCSVFSMHSIFDALIIHVMRYLYSFRGFIYQEIISTTWLQTDREII